MSIGHNAVANRGDGDNDKPVEPLVERHYVLPVSTRNLAAVATEIPQDVYTRMATTIEMLGQAQQRSLGIVSDREPSYYTFDGTNVYLRGGLAQVGTAITTDAPGGFPMMRLFSNSMDEMGALEKECGLWVECVGQKDLPFEGDADSSKE